MGTVSRHVAEVPVKDPPMSTLFDVQDNCWKSWKSFVTVAALSPGLSGCSGRATCSGTWRSDGLTQVMPQLSYVMQETAALARKATAGMAAQGSVTAGRANKSNLCLQPGDASRGDPQTMHHHRLRLLSLLLSARSQGHPRL
jgi:hypothetical protein